MFTNKTRCKVNNNFLNNKIYFIMKRIIFVVMRGRYIKAAFLYKNEAKTFCQDLKKIFNLDTEIQEIYIYG